MKGFNSINNRSRAMTTPSVAGVQSSDAAGLSSASSSSSSLPSCAAEGTGAAPRSSVSQEVAAAAPIAGGSWDRSLIPPMRIPRFNFAAVAVQNQILVFGGFTMVTKEGRGLNFTSAAESFKVGDNVGSAPSQSSSAPSSGASHHSGGISISSHASTCALSNTTSNSSSNNGNSNGNSGGNNNNNNNGRGSWNSFWFCPFGSVVGPPPGYSFGAAAIVESVDPYHPSLRLSDSKGDLASYFSNPETMLMNKKLNIVIAGGSRRVSITSDVMDLKNAESATSTNLPHMRTSRCGCAITSCYGISNNHDNNRVVFVVGGRSADGDVGRYHDTVEYYNTTPHLPLPEFLRDSSAGDTSNSWKVLPSNMIIGRAYCAAVMVMSGWDARQKDAAMHLVVMGGTLPGKIVSKTVECYSFKTNEWLPLPPMTEARAECAAVAIGPHVYVMGGASSDGTALATVERFNFQTKKWTLLPNLMTTPRRGCAAVVVDRHIVVLGGVDELNTVVSSVEVLKIGCADVHMDIPFLPPIRADAVGRDDRAAALENWCIHARAKLSKAKCDLDHAMESITNLRNHQVIAAQEDYENDVSTKRSKYEKDIAARKAKFEMDLQDAKSSRDQKMELAKEDAQLQSRRLVETTEDWIVRTFKRIRQAEEEIRILRQSSNLQKVKLVGASGGGGNHSATGLMAGARSGSMRVSGSMAGGGAGAGAGAGSSSANSVAHVSVCPTESSEGGGEPRHELICPLTHDVMVDPVIAADGHCYERRAIEEWFSNFSTVNNPTSPNTNIELPSRTLIPAIALKSLCDSFRQSHYNLLASDEGPPEI